MKRFLSIIILAALLLGGGYVGWQFLRPQKVAAEEVTAGIPTGTITIGSIEELVSATGNVESERNASLVMTVSGQVQAVNVEVGDAFSEGDLLVQLDDSTARESVDRNQASYESAVARLVQAKEGPSEGSIAAAEASVASAQASLDKLLTGPTEEDIQAAQYSIDTAKNSLWSAQANRDATAGSRSASGAAIDAAEASVLNAEVAVQQAELNFDRLFVEPTAEDIAAAQAAVDAAEASLAQLYEQPRAVDIAVSEASLAESELALAQAKAALQDAQLQAPFDGTALTVYATEDEWMAAGQPVVEIADMEHMELIVLLDEVDVAAVAEGQDVILYFDALPDAEVPGTVVDVAPSATNTTSGVAFQVTVAFEPGDLPIRLGMTATVDIVVERVEDAVLVPNQAIEADRVNNLYFVNVKDGNAVERTEIEIGLRDDDYTQVIDGIDQGNEVLLQVIELTEAEAGLESIRPEGADDGGLIGGN